MRTSVFVYYKVAAGRGDDARVAATALLDDVEHATGVGARLMARADDVQTWMEVYEPVDDPTRLLAEIERCLPRSGLSPCLLGPRHSEVFTEMAPPRCA
ncbi:DUF4936 family protein [Niveibacterium sp. 24ML]|uniref:DUF4936 family protein n=1 Tax=Niveibacterium sp. 24ML TaxID=2985512 RepID=UPI00226E987F|nr:DUF4936 family protein [Niveibacterium sp. 24ML]MCX9156729.1 DUF4936 family protein [Niveibacterium sp. 24ML]